ncbi:MAG: excinuclease ABC subunit B, partial [Chloroflexi bacterium]|nr:excinuclease ABC subunit B [Chloroflexota bacterium]
MELFKLHAPFAPAGDQPDAIAGLVEGINGGERFQTLLGVTGSGKTFTVANVIAQVNRPTLVLAPNKTLAAQLCSEFREFFPENAVEYFVSYYDYYQPEAYIARTDTYIDKEVDINKQIEKLRLSATRSVFSRRDVIVVASVSCIYGIGSPVDYGQMTVSLKKDAEYDIYRLLRRLTDLQYARNDQAPTHGNFRLRGDVLEVFPSYDDFALRFEFFGDELERILQIDTLTGEILAEHDAIEIYPARHYVA